MSSCRASLFAILVIAITSCSKQNTLPSQSVPAADSENDLAWRPFLKKNNTGGGNDSIFKLTTFGVVQEQNPNKIPQENMNNNIQRMKNADVTLTRVFLNLSKSPVNKTIDAYLQQGYHVQISVDWDNAGNGKRHFPTPAELQEFKMLVKEFYEHYAPYTEQIAFVSFENEWDWQIINNDAVLDDFLQELAAAAEIGHQYGFKVTDGGITSTGLKRWTYSQLSGEEAKEWLNTYWVGLESGKKYYDYDKLIAMVNTFTSFAKNLNLNYSNIHWNNQSECGNGFGTATEKFRIACNIAETVCNEFSVGTNSFDLFSKTVGEIRSNAKAAVAYSGFTSEGRAIELTDEMLGELN